MAGTWFARFWYWSVWALSAIVFINSAPATRAVAGDASAAGYHLTPLWEATGFSEPESVFTFAGHPWIYVSNPNGVDKPGYISRVAKDGTIDALKWVEGFKLPTGMAHYDGDLFVVDLTRVIQIDLDTGKVVGEFLSDIDDNGLRPSGAPVVLNDVSIDLHGRMYVTALGAGLYVNDGNTLVAWSSLTPGAGLISLPNGIAAGEDALYVGSMGESFESLQQGNFGPIVKVSYTNGSVSPIVGSPLAGWDGLDFLNNGIIASSPPTGDIWFIKDGKGELVANVGIDNQISDTGIDTDKRILYAPMLRANKVIAYQLVGFD